MNDYNALEKRYLDKKVPCGASKMLLLKPNDALALILELLMEDYLFLGLDGFNSFPDGSIQPNQDISTDESHYDSYKECVQDSILLISKNYNNPVIFEVVFDSKKK